MAALPMETPAPPPHEPADDETGARLRLEPPDDDENIDAKLQLADLRRRLAGAEVEPVRFRRWEIVHRLGRGGMGAVYLARDPELDRSVALKVLAPFTGSERVAMSQRLQREAQALARIDHPNVVKVHRVDLDQGRPVIEMELVEGTTLRQWQRERRGWREVVEAYVEVGEGLAAIHAAELVHRDIKPDNLLRKPDGRIKIVDLGLAIGPRSASSATTTGAASHTRLLAERITHGSDVAGTPAYMAPERFGRADGSVAADQFSFAVSLYEGLYGVLPFRTDDPACYAEDLAKGRLQMPAQCPRRPGWLAAALRRALQANPSERHPSMKALVEVLRRGLHRRRWWGLGATLLGASVGLPALGWVLGSGKDHCAPLEQRLLEENQADRLGPLRARVLDAGAPHLERALQLLQETHAERWGQWSEAELALCETKAHRQTPPADLEPRAACLEGVRQRLDAVAAGPGRDDTDLAQWLVESTKALERLPPCDGPVEQLEPWVAELASADAKRLRERLDQAAALELAGDHARAEAEARAIARASEEAFPRLHAEALYRLGHVLGSDDRGSEAFEALRSARNAAIVIDDDVLLCEVVAYRAKLTANVQLDPETSTDDVGAAAACLEKTSPRSILVRADMLEARGLLAQAMGEFEDAMEWHRQALALRRDHLGPQGYDVSKSLQNLANALEEAGRPTEAIAPMTEALAVRRAVLGPEHPKVADVLFDLGQLQRALGNAVQARESLEHARRIRITLGTSASANLELSLALLDLDEGNLDAAAEHLRVARAQQDGDRRLAPYHPDRARLLQAEGVLCVLRNDSAGALEAFARSTEILRRHDPDAPDVLDSTLRELAMLYDMKRYDELTRRVELESEPLLTYVAALPPDERGRFAWYIGESSLALHRNEQAATYLRLAQRAYEELGQHHLELEEQLRRATENSPPHSTAEPH